MPNPMPPATDVANPANEAAGVARPLAFASAGSGRIDPKAAHSAAAVAAHGDRGAGEHDEQDRLDARADDRGGEECQRDRVEQTARAGADRCDAEREREKRRQAGLHAIGQPAYAHRRQHRRRESEPPRPFERRASQGQRQQGGDEAEIGEDRDELGGQIAGDRRMQRRREEQEHRARRPEGDRVAVGRDEAMRQQKLGQAQMNQRVIEQVEARVPQHEGEVEQQRPGHGNAPPRTI
jgi:hypothetical protein